MKFTSRNIFTNDKPIARTLNSQILILTESGIPEISDVFDIFSSLVISNWPDGPGDGEPRPGTHLGELATPLSVKPTPPLFAPVVPPISSPTAAVQPTAPTAWLGPVAPPTMSNPPDRGWGSWQLCPSPLFACCPKDCPVTPDGLAATVDCWNIRSCLWPRDCRRGANAACTPAVTADTMSDTIPWGPAPLLILPGCADPSCWLVVGMGFAEWDRRPAWRSVGERDLPWPRRELVTSPGDRDLLRPRRKLVARLCAIRRLLRTGWSAIWNWWEV